MKVGVGIFSPCAEIDRNISLDRKNMEIAITLASHLEGMRCVCMRNPPIGVLLTKPNCIGSHFCYRIGGAFFLFRRQKNHNPAISGNTKAETRRIIPMRA